MYKNKKIQPKKGKEDQQTKTKQQTDKLRADS